MPMKKQKSIDTREDGGPLMLVAASIETPPIFFML